MTRTATKTRKLPPSTAVVTQSNELVLARYSLPVSEMRLLMTVISKIQPTDTKLTVYRIPVGEFAEFLGVDKNSAYREIRKVTKSLVTRYLEIKDVNRIIQTTWVASATYIDGSGVAEIRLDETLLPYLIGLNENFTQCKLGMLLSFKSVYTNRLYMLLKQKRNHNPYAKSYEIELNELRKILGVSVERIARLDKADKAQEPIELYIEYPNFKKFVLEIARKELGEKNGTNGKADIGFEYEEIRHGRRVTAISFRVFQIQRAELLPELMPVKPMQLGQQSSLPGMDLDLLETLISFVPAQHRAKKGVRATIEAAEKQHGFDYVKRNILYSNAHAFKNYAGYLAGALAMDYGHDWEIEQQQAAKAAEKAQPQVTLADLKALSDEILGLQSTLRLFDNPAIRDQVEKLKAEYARKREIYDAENTQEEETTA